MGERGRGGDGVRGEGERKRGNGSSFSIQCIHVKHVCTNFCISVKKATTVHAKLHSDTAGTDHKIQQQDVYIQEKSHDRTIIL